MTSRDLEDLNSECACDPSYQSAEVKENESIGVLDIPPPINFGFKITKIK